MPRSVRQEWRDTAFRPHVVTVPIPDTSAERSARALAATGNGSFVEATCRDGLASLRMPIWKN